MPEPHAVAESPTGHVAPALTGRSRPRRAPDARVRACRCQREGAIRRPAGIGSWSPIRGSWGWVIAPAVVALVLLIAASWGVVAAAPLVEG
jgi:hypothetical protein